MLTFYIMEKKFGSAAAHQYLAEIEKIARIPSAKTFGLDPEIRLANACRVQDELAQNTAKAA